MAKYKDYSYDQGVFLPVYFDKQILPGTFEYTLNHLIDNELDLSSFDNRYKNDEIGSDFDSEVDFEYSDSEDEKK